MLKTVIIFLTWPPSHIFVVAAIFGFLLAAALAAKYFYPQLRCSPLFIIVVMWLAFGVHQSDPQLQRFNIRLDLLVILPVLFGGTILLTVFQFWSLVRALRSTKR
jgi:hypothetical protein